MRKETPVPGDEHDVAQPHARDVDLTDEENVGRPDGRQHAGSRHTQLRFTDLPQQRRHKLGRSAADARPSLRSG
jgi:hypothetical protein